MVMGPMWTRYSSMSGEVTQQMIDYYSARARGGAAMIVIEATAVDKRYGYPEATLRLDGPDVLPRFHALVEAIHLNGAAVLDEIVHVGAFAENPVSPSGVASVRLAGVGVSQPRVMSLEEIEEAREKFISASVRAKHTGCDGVVVHGQTAYLLHHFVSPYTNKRTDKYGGSLENRMRLPLEIVRGIREKCGPDFVLGYALVCDEFLPGGITYADSVPFAKALEKEGVDFLDIAVGTYETFASTDRSPGQSKYTRFGEWQHTEVFKKEVGIPVVHRTLGDYDPRSWERHLGAGHADLIQIAKPLLCDPEFINYVLNGRLEDVRMCTTCTHCLDVGIIGCQQVECALNPETGRERDYAIRPASKKKRVLIVGGGPAGLEAARVAALRGHEVTLMEKDDELGGNLRVLSLCADNEPYGSFRDWEIRQCRNAGVKFELGREATLQMIEGAGADAVIVATGAPKRVVPDIVGVVKPHVVTPEDVLSGKASVGKAVVVIGGNRIGMDMAYTVMKKGLAKTATIIESRSVDSIGYDMEVMNVAMMTLCLLSKLGVTALTGTRIEEIASDGVRIIDPEGKKQKIPADTVILSAGYLPDPALLQSIRGKVKEVHAIGDCVEYRNVRDAVHEAAFVARQL
jgi:2,4-dienoyl-CoA reductase-like NADH-dependent reductase (Old Yellow Enzyme family)/NADPH-dependent 2,4-dienoyl-CoA reductase/sulfur reductase-like enzyme